MDEYGSLARMRRNGIEQKDKIEVPSARSKRKRPVSSLKMRVEMLDQNSALRPKAANGKAVAVPRCSGKLHAAVIIGLALYKYGVWRNVPVLIAPPKAEQPPMPVRKVKKHSSTMGIDPSPLLYAVNIRTIQTQQMNHHIPQYIGKYPKPKEIDPISVISRGPRASVNKPIGIPIAYIPRFPATP
jgi:hypothetical protein